VPVLCKIVTKVVSHRDVGEEACAYVPDIKRKYAPTREEPTRTVPDARGAASGLPELLQSLGRLGHFREFGLYAAEELDCTIFLSPILKKQGA